MADIIQVLPDAVANQIAAGEVIQRPASVIKELMENSVDAGADHIQLIVREAGKSLIQVIDNGSGMSESDARLCFERHATSKIHTAADLFDLYTFGFRGEAMASIAAVAKLSLKTKRYTDELATCIEIEGSNFISQQPCQGANGTSITVKNLFYNVPARRKFLKSNVSELRNIIQEFQRVAMVHPEIEFIFHQNDKLVFQLLKGSLKERIVAIFGKNYQHRLVNFDLESDIAKVQGYISKPEFAKRNRGEQYFFVNGRYFKHPYFHHAVIQAFEGLLQKDYFPSYFIYLEVKPADLDINIHPTKTEINFSEQQYMYAMLRSSIQESLGRFNIAPSMDFESKETFDYSPPSSGEPIKIPQVSVDPTFNPFEKGNKTPSQPSFDNYSKKKVPEQWENMYEGLQNIQAKSEQQMEFIPSDEKAKPSSNGNINFMQLHFKYILSMVKSGMMIISQHRAHFRIRYEQLLRGVENKKFSSQGLLFEVSLSLTSEEDIIFKTLIDSLHDLGFKFRSLGKHDYVFSALPIELPENELDKLIHKMIDNVSFQDKEFNLPQTLSRTLAKNTAIKAGKKLQREEMENLVNALFSTSMPEIDPDGKPILRIMGMDELEQMFK